MVVSEEEIVDVLAPAAAIACGKPFHLSFLVRLWDVSNVSRPRRYSLGEARAMCFQKRTDGLVNEGNDGDGGLWFGQWSCRIDARKGVDPG